MPTYRLKNGTVIQNDDPNAPNYAPDMNAVAQADGANPNAPLLATFDLDPAQKAEAERLAAEQAQAASLAAAAAEKNRVTESRFQYGGHAGGAAEAADRYNKRGEAAQNRPGEVINYGNANAARDMGLGARQQQVNMAQLMADRASGKVPSIAQLMADRQMGQAAAEQTSAAASARGPAGLALAQQQAAANTAHAQANISGQAQIAAAQERLDAERAAMGAYTQMRGGDATLQGQDADQAKAQAAINAAQRAQNDAFQLGNTQAEIDVQKSQLNAQGNKVATDAGIANAAAARDQAKGFHEDDRFDKYLGAGLAGGGTVLAASLPVIFGGSGKGGSDPGTNPLAGPGDVNSVNSGQGDSTLPDYSPGRGYDPDDPFRADGGPIAAGRPYVVGERGPELVVPRRDGFVVPNEHMRGLAYHAAMRRMMGGR